MSSRSALRAIATLSLCLGLGLARAQDSEPYDADPPDRAARLSIIQGDVSMQPVGEQDWAPAILNRPLTTGDNLWTGQNSRAEIQVGAAAIRLNGETGFSFLNVDNDTIQMRMTAGVISVRVRALDENELVEVDTPNVALSLLRPGSYRVEVNDGGDTTVVKISEGEAEASGSGESVVVREQQVATFRGTGQFAAQFGTLSEADEFDSWNLDRDRRDYLAASSQTAEHVSPEVTGYEDLDDNGTWSSEAGYGYVWTPTRVAAGWSPYRYGRWSWVAPWGWTWIDDAPWGYAPFHYGRWAQVRNRWCWVPGPRHARAVYAPALVRWAGDGRAAWYPLGPREVYVPWQRFSPRYVERVNVTNTMIVRQTVHEAYQNRARNVAYHNRVMPGAVTTVTRARVRPPPPAVVNRQVVVRQTPPRATADRTIRTQDHGVRQRSIVSETVNMNRAERPPRPERPVKDMAPRAQPAVPDRRAAPELEQRREAEILQRRVQQQVQEHRQREPATSHPRAERPQVARPQVARPQVSRPQVARPQDSHPDRSTTRPPADAKPQPPRRQDDGSRPQRN